MPEPGLQLSSADVDLVVLPMSKVEAGLMGGVDDGG